VRRRGRAAGITTEVYNHTFRGTGVADLLDDLVSLLVALVPNGDRKLSALLEVHHDRERD
jgi:hypothetical protein